MRARAWSMPADEVDEFKPREIPKVVARLMRMQVPKDSSEKVC